MRLFVFGTDGQIARSLREHAQRDSEVIFGFSGRLETDISEPSSVEAVLTKFRPDVVINPAAYTAVDRAEAEPVLAYSINRDGAGIVAKAAARLGVPVIHLSTDYVFDGRKSGSYVESDPVSPQSIYGFSKLAGERAVAQENPKHIILRTSWVYAPFGNNFVRTVLRLVAERDRLAIVDDQFGCPTYAPDIAGVIIDIARQSANWQDRFAGVTHLAGPDRVTWCELARKIVRLNAERGGRLVPVDSIATSDYPAVAIRPVNSGLSTARLSQLFSARLPPLAESLKECLDRLSQN